MAPLFWSSYALIWLLVGFQGLAFLEVLRQLAALRRRVGPDQGPALLPVDSGARLPPLAGVSAYSLEHVRWDERLTKELGVVVFLTPHCATCRDVAAGLAELRRNIGSKVDLLAIVQGDASAADEFIEATGLPRAMTVIDEHEASAKALGLNVNPAGLTVREGRIGIAGVVNTAHQVEALLDTRRKYGEGREEAEQTAATIDALIVGGASE